MARSDGQESVHTAHTNTEGFAALRCFSVMLPLPRHKENPR